MKRSENPNILRGPFMAYGILSLVKKFVDNYKDRLPDEKDPLKKFVMSGDGINMYQNYILGKNDYFTDEFEIFFPVLTDERIKIEFKVCGVGRRGCNRTDSCHFSISLNYDRDFGRTKKGKRIKNKLFIGTKQSFNLQSVFDGMEEAIRFIHNQEDNTNKNEKIKEIEKMSWDGIMLPAFPDESFKRFSSWVQMDETSQAISYHGQYNTNHGMDELNFNFKEKFDTEGKKYIILDELKLYFKGDYSEKKCPIFKTQEEMKEIIEMAKEFTEKLTNKLKEKPHGEKTTS